MKIAFRVDASLALGTGHVMRCLTLAGVLRERGASASFLCRTHGGHLCDLIEERGFPVTRLQVSDDETPNGFQPNKPVLLGTSWQKDSVETRAVLELEGVFTDLLVVDHYSIDSRWEQNLRPVVGRVFVIDDLADRPHDCDILLDQNLHDSPDSRYSGLVSSSTRLFIGPRYALLRPEFDGAIARPRDLGLRKLLVYFGGTDPTNESLKVVLALRELGAGAPLATFVLGSTNPHAAIVRQNAAGTKGMRIITATDQMARLMDEADLGIGTCGGAAWERCVLGLPSLVAINADNQRDDARILHAMGAVRNLGDVQTTTVAGWTAEIRALQDDSDALDRMGRASAAVMCNRKAATRELEAALVG